MVLKEFVSSLLKKIRNRKFLYLLMACFSLALFSLFFIFVASNGFDRKIVLLDKKWKITDSDSTYESMDVRDYKVPANIEIGSQIVFENILDSAIAPRSTLNSEATIPLYPFISTMKACISSDQICKRGNLSGAVSTMSTCPRMWLAKN